MSTALDKRAGKAKATLHYLTHMLVILGALLIGVPLIMITSPSFESTFFPVIKHMEFDINSLSDGTMAVTVEGVKVRECEFISVIGISKTNTRAVEVSVQYSGLNGWNNTRAIGLQSFGTWIIEPLGNTVTLYARHNCHPGWVTTTKLGKIDLKNYVPGDHNDLKPLK